MTRLALHLPNREFVADDIGRIKATGITEFVDLHHFRERWPLVREQIPGAEIHARIDARGPLGNPREEAHNAADVIRSADADSWRYRNEPQLEGVTDWRQWRDWLIVFGQTLRDELPGDVLYAPAVSPGTPDWYDWLAATTEGALDWADGLDLHVYGDPGEVRANLEVARVLWPKPRRLFVTEHNFGAGRSYDLSRYAADIPHVIEVCAEYGVEACCLFIWQWHSPDMVLPTTVDVKGTVVEAALANGPGGNMWDRHVVYDRWAKQFGGQGANVDDAFGQAIERRIVVNVGCFTGGYQGYGDEACPYLYCYTTNGVLYVPKSDTRAESVRFARREGDLPLT